MWQYRYGKNVDSEKKIILDTNSFYDFLGWAGVSFDGLISPQTNTHIDYLKLNNEFASLLKGDAIALSNVLLFEVISHFRENPKILYRIFKKIQDFTAKEGHNPFLMVCPNIFFSLGPSTDGREYWDLMRPSDIMARIDDVVEKKIDSEAYLLSIFVFMIASAYILSCYGLSSKYGPMMSVFRQTLENTDNAKIVLNLLRKEIKDKLVSSYQQHQEKKTFRKIFVKELETCAGFLLVQMDFIQDCLDKNDAPTFFFSNQLQLGKKVLTKTISKWYFSDTENPKKLTDFCNELNHNILQLGYSKVQGEYFRQMIFSIFSTQTFVDKNDAEDFVFLGLIQSGNLLLSFDGQMDEAIKTGDPNNYAYITQFHI